MDYLYYPFTDSAGVGVLKTVEEHWQAEKLKKGKVRMYHRFYGTVGGDMWLPGIGANEDLYIFGHCGAGEDTLQSWKHESTIKVNDLADALKTKGLPEGFAGKIKIYGCSSGASSSWAMGALTWQSFAQKFADAMYLRGYRSCTFFGYTESVRSLYENINGNMHKGTAPGWTTPAKRAKSVRVEFISKYRSHVITV